jgi:thiol-disulfide isomerase/thioredoxin
VVNKTEPTILWSIQLWNKPDIMKKLILLLALFIPTVHAEVFNIKDFNLEKYSGKVVYLDFWASWCKPCQKSFPWMNKLHSKYPSDKFEVVTINLDQQSADMEDFLKKIPAGFDIYHDPDGKIAEKFQLQGMPTSFLINARGKLVKKHIGFYNDKRIAYEKEIEALL